MNGMTNNPYAGIERTINDMAEANARGYFLHTEDCVLWMADEDFDPEVWAADEGECSPSEGQWDQPPGVSVQELQDRLPEGVPWCRLRVLAFALAAGQEV